VASNRQQINDHRFIEAGDAMVDVPRKIGRPVPIECITFLREPAVSRVWSHFMDGAPEKACGLRYVPNNAGDLVETGFLMEGLLTARQYFPRAKRAREELYENIRTYGTPSSGIGTDALRKVMHSIGNWSPDFSWHINHRITGFNEAMIIYLLAIASPTHAVPADLYYTGWAGESKAAVEYRKDWSNTEKEIATPTAQLRRDKTGCGSGQRRSSIFRALFLYGIRSAFSRSLHGLFRE